MTLTETWLDEPTTCTACGVFKRRGRWLVVPTTGLRFCLLKCAVDYSFRTEESHDR